MVKTGEKMMLVTAGLNYLHEVLALCLAAPAIQIKILIGHDGMGPEISLHFFGGRHLNSAPEIEIQLWQAPNPDLAGILIYSAFDPLTEALDHQTHHLQTLSEAQPYFRRAVQWFRRIPIQD
jgi:hypothetical protein